MYYRCQKSSKDFMGMPKKNLAILMYEDREELDERTFDGVVSVNLGEFIGIPNACYLDTNNLPNIDIALEQAGLGKRTDMKKRSGFCEYPLFVFDEEVLKELEFGIDTYKEYIEQYE